MFNGPTREPPPHLLAVGCMLGTYGSACLASHGLTLDDGASIPQHYQQPMVEERTKITVELSADLVEECRNAVVYLSGPPDRLTLAGLVADALREELDRLRNLRNEGESFPQRDSDLRGGRPLR
jgi:hypothetical protein